MKEAKATDRVNSNRTDGFLWSSLKDAWWLKAKIKTFSDGVFSDYKYKYQRAVSQKDPCGVRFYISLQGVKYRL